MCLNVELLVYSVLVMRVAGGLFVESEEFSELPQREVTLHVLLLIHHAAAQGLLMGLPLEDLLLDRPRLSAHKHTGQTWKRAPTQQRGADSAELTESSL